MWPADRLPDQIPTGDAPVGWGEWQFRRMLDKLPAAAYTCDPEGLITYYNPRAVELWGRAPRLLHPEDRFCGSFKLFETDGTPIRHDQCWMALALLNQREYNGHEILIERPDGSRITALAHANPISGPADGVSGAVNVLVDISERKKVEAVLREADRNKDEFLATLSHELRNPLAPVRNALTLLLQSAAMPSEEQQLLGIMDRQVDHLIRLVDDLLDLARITQGRLELQKETVLLDTILDDAVEMARPAVSEHEHTLRVARPPESVLLEVDKVRLTQALTNLLNNAASYTPQGGRIDLRAEIEGTSVVFRVKDDGMGIAAEDLRDLFEPFAGAHRHGSGHQGLGLGLSVVKHVVALHGGRVTGRSAGLGKGSEFTIRLPTGEPADRTVEGEPTSSGRRADDASTKKVLVVDDYLDGARTLGLLFEALGAEVSLAGDGAEALRQVESFRPDWVLLDIAMPGMDGYDVAERIRAMPDVAPTLIAVTGWGQDKDRARALAAGFDHHMTKPVDIGALRTLMSL